MKKILAILVCLVMAFSAVALVACDEGAKGTELLLWGPAGDQEFLKAQGAAWAEAYNAANETDYVVEVRIMPEGEAGTNVINGPNEAADVFLFADDHLPRLETAKALAAIGDPTVAGSTAEKIAKANNKASVNAATGITVSEGELLAYPMTSDNTYFLYYNSNIVTAEQAKSMEGIIAAAKAADAKVYYNIEDSWTGSSLFFGYGSTLNPTECKHDEVAEEVVAALLWMKEQGVIFNVNPDGAQEDWLAEEAAVVITGNWKYADYSEGNDFTKLTVLPTINNYNDTADTKAYQLMPFLGSKLVGVNAATKQGLAAHALADYLTNEQGQIARLVSQGNGPSNLEAAKHDAVAQSPTLRVIAEQAKNAHPQGGNTATPGDYWKAVETFNKAIVSADYMPINRDLLIATMTESMMTAPV